MMVDLEKYIRSNRSQLDDVESFDVDQMWHDFDQKHKPVRRLRPWYFAAAAVAVLLLGLTMFLNNADPITQDDLVYQKLVEIDPALAAEQVSMQQMVSEQGNLIVNLGITQSQFPELFNEIKVLDSLQLDYLHDLDNYPDRKNLTRTLLRHYQRKARLLELMLYEFEKLESESKYETAKAL